MGGSNRRLINFIAFVAVITTAIALVLEYILGAGTDAGRICNWISFISMLVVVILASFFFATSKRNRIFLILYIAAVVVIVIFKVLPLF